MKRLFVIGLLLFAGCKGPKGDKGDAGPTRVGTLLGPISGNVFSVYDSRLNSTNSISVYVGSSTSWAELPYLLPAYGVNAYYIFGVGSITFYNCDLTGAPLYNIVIVTKNAPAASMQDRLLGMD